MNTPATATASLRATADQVAKTYSQINSKNKPPVLSVGRNHGVSSSSGSDSNTNNRFVNSSVSSSISDAEDGISSGSNESSPDQKPALTKNSFGALPSSTSAASGRDSNSTFLSSTNLQIHDEQQTIPKAEGPTSVKWSDDVTADSKTISTRRIPCDAAVKHQSKNPYFVTTSQTKHGEGLECSDPECRKNGFKFRYCAICETAVARRNFRSQHNHDMASVCSTATSGKGKKRRRKGGDNDSTPRSSVVSIPVQQNSKRNQHWDELLGKRPDMEHNEKMTQWLMKVLAVSDPEMAGEN